METTFITIHDLSPDARILYSSDSVVDILGYTPDEVLHRSCWDFFHPDELPFARDLHSRGVKLDKAAMLSYCQLRNRQSQWVCCECCFTIVYDVMVVCTSIYRRGLLSQSRAVQAPIVRRLFSSSPKDPRYHMLSHLSKRFSQTEQQRTHEPRAALFLNRFTRTLTIMYATAGVEKILGVSGEDMKGKSFYYCIQEDCLEEAVRCLESAKANDSIAYLRFWFRDPRIDDPPSQDDTVPTTGTDTDASMTDATSDPSDTEWEDRPDIDTPKRGESSTSDVAGHDHMSHSPPGAQTHREPTLNGDSTPGHAQSVTNDTDSSNDRSRTSSGADSTPADQTHTAIFGERSNHTSRSSDATTPLTTPEPPQSNDRCLPYRDIELEAVISCTSDGLVVCLRRARPLVPPSLPQSTVQFPTYKSGTFAAPWATSPVYSPSRPQDHSWPPQAYASVRPTLPSAQPVAASDFTSPPQGPHSQTLFDSIRDTAIFAWALTSINGTLAEWATNPHDAKGESQPPDGLPVWDGGGETNGIGDENSQPPASHDVNGFATNMSHENGSTVNGSSIDSGFVDGVSQRAVLPGAVQRPAAAVDSRSEVQ